MPRKFVFIIGFMVAVAMAGIAVLSIPPIRDRLVWHLDEWKLQVRYALFPPEEALFVPQEKVDAMVQATLQAMVTSTATLLPPTPTATLEPEQPTPTPEPSPTPIPASVSLDGVRYMDQHGLWNYCAPSTLAMDLSFWGWQGDRTTTGQVLKPFEKDKNVMMYEMADYVTQYTNLAAAVRYGGTQEVLKKLIAAGYPPLVEKGPFIKDVSGKVTWMGHYTVLTGYDDAKSMFISQDAYFSPDYPVTYDQLDKEWRAFDYIFLVVYPPDQQDQVFKVLGEYSDEARSIQIAADRSAQEMNTLSGLDQFFAYYNRGTSLTLQQNYTDAAPVYDQAFQIMAQLPSKDRPWRMLWYQTGPYYAYYFTGRFQDVINLADNTLNNISEPYLEESFVWRARARIALGDSTDAADDVLKALEYHPGFTPAEQLAQQLGIGG